MISLFPKNDSDQVLRLKQFFVAFASYVMWMVIIVYADLQDLIHIPFVLLCFYILGVLFCNVFLYAVIRTGRNKRFKDPSLTLLQMVVAVLWTAVAVYYAGSLRSAMLLIYLTVFLFGMFKLKVRQFLLFSAFTLISYTMVIVLLCWFHPESVNKQTEILNILILTGLLPWFSVVGGYITRLLTKIYDERLASIENLLHDIRDVIFVVDMNLNYIYVSPSVKMLRGYEPDEVLKQAPLDALAPSSFELVTKTFTAFVELEKLGHKVPSARLLQLEVKRKDGTTVWTETLFSLVRDENGRPLRIIGVMRDISERKGRVNP